MTLKGYEFRHAGSGRKKDPPLIQEHKYTFKASPKNLKYIVNVEEYPHNVYVLKFHLKNHTHSKWKYCELTDVGLVPARKILFTCIDIGYQIRSKNELASFGFLGNPTKEEVRTKHFNKTKRFRVYDNYARFFFSPDTYEHIMDEEKSIYLLLNKKAVAKEPKLLSEITKLFQKNFDLEALFSNLVFEETTKPKGKKKKKMWR